VEWEHVQDTMDAVRRLKEDGYTIVSAEQTVDSVMLDTFVPDQDKKYAVVFGNEVAGVSQDVVDASDFALEIPQFGTKHSLNVSVSMGVILWHFKLYKH
jgi:tRNA G18 (ribose-2'-O)-methylase SpoU